MEPIDTRKLALEQWLIQSGLNRVEMKAMPNHASFRRYFRVLTPTQTYVAMDAPPPQENCQPYVAIAKALRSIGLQAPEIIAATFDQGFLLLTDFGDQTYLKTLNAQNADQLYSRALKALALLQGLRHVPERVIPPFTAQFMWQEWEWHKEWFLGKLLGLTSLNKELDECVKLLVDVAAVQPQVFMHRDYHSANLMVLASADKQESAVAQVGILDFQDAFMGPLTYDLVSLLQDCYIDWPAERVRRWVEMYWQLLRDLRLLQTISIHEFQYWFDWMGIQRHLKALFTFARKYLRDHQSYYLQFIPRTVRYIIDVSQHYSQLTCMHAYFSNTVMPTFAQVQPLCVA